MRLPNKSFIVTANSDTADGVDDSITIEVLSKAADVNLSKQAGAIQLIPKGDSGGNISEAAGHNVIVSLDSVNILATADKVEDGLPNYGQEKRTNRFA